VFVEFSSEGGESPSCFAVFAQLTLFINSEGIGCRDLPVSSTAIEKSYFSFNGYASADRQRIRIELCFGWPQVISLVAVMRDSSSEIKNSILRY